MIRRLASVLGLLLTGCQARQEPSTYVERRTPDGALIRTEMRHGLANGRIIAYSPTGRIAAILHVRDSVLTGNTYSFYPSGRVAHITSYVGGYLTGREWQFYEQGGPKSMVTYVDDEQTGPARGYYPTGSLQYTATLWRGQRSGLYQYFYHVPANRVRRRVEYVLVRGKQWENGYVDYSPTGAITARVEQLASRFNQPRYALRDTVELTLHLQGPQFTRVKATVADFDSLFNGNDSTAGHVVYGHRGVVRLRVRPQRAGLNYVRGYVTDYDSGASPLKGVLYETKEKNVYFQRSYWVDKN